MATTDKSRRQGLDRDLKNVSVSPQDYVNRIWEERTAAEDQWRKDHIRMHELEADAVIKSSLGATLYEAFVRAKWEEIEEYQMKVTDWEVERYLEQA